MAKFDKDALAFIGIFSQEGQQPEAFESTELTKPDPSLMQAKKGPPPGARKGPPGGGKPFGRG